MFIENMNTVHPWLSEPRLSEPSFNYQNSQKLVNFNEFHYFLQDGGHLIVRSVFQPPLVFFTLTVFMLMLMLEVQKGCNGDVDTCI